MMIVKTKGSTSESYPQKATEYRVKAAPTDAFYVGQAFNDDRATSLTLVIAWSADDALQRYVEKQCSLYTSGETRYHVLEVDVARAYTLTPTE